MLVSLINKDVAAAYKKKPVIPLVKEPCCIGENLTLTERLYARSGEEERFNHRSTYLSPPNLLPRIPARMRVFWHLESQPLGRLHDQRDGIRTFSTITKAFRMSSSDVYQDTVFADFGL
ncbi:hypothetical protein GCM10009077_32130 [Roseibium denhamense]